eukprot:gene12762-26895_t
MSQQNHLRIDWGWFLGYLNSVFSMNSKSIKIYDNRHETLKDIQLIDYGILFTIPEHSRLCPVHPTRSSTIRTNSSKRSFLSSSRTQYISIDSSTIAAFVATHVAAREILWTQSLLFELGGPTVFPI